MVKLKPQLQIQAIQKTCPVAKANTFHSKDEIQKAELSSSKPESVSPEIKTYRAVQEVEAVKDG